MTLVIFSIICLLGMIIFFCIYAIRSKKPKECYGNDYYHEGAENFNLNKKSNDDINESDDYFEFSDKDKDSGYDKSSQDNNDKTFEKVF